MSKKDTHYEEAERLYIYENLPPDVIAEKLNISKRTVFYWKASANWNEKKKKYIQSKTAFHDELYDFSRELMYSIRQDMKEGRKVDQARLFTFGRTVPLITKIKDYEEGMKNQEKRINQGLTEEVIDLIQEQILGIKLKRSKEECS